jgi:hypothetical protein
VDLSNRLRKAGWRLISDSRLQSIHHGDPATLGGLFRGELWRGRGNLRVALRGPWTFRAIAGALVPVAYLASLLAIPIGAALIPAGAGGLALAGLAAAGALTALRAGRMLRRLDRRGARDVLQALAVACVYEAARALALVAMAGHRRRKLEPTQGPPCVENGLRGP